VGVQLTRTIRSDPSASRHVTVAIPVREYMPHPLRFAMDCRSVRVTVDHDVDLVSVE
jgi:hypothetical protein